jgi:hypothetical protein
MFSIKRNRKKEILLNVNFNLLDFLTNFFVTLNKIFSSKAFYLIPTGLGIGFGIGVVVFSQPSKINAGEPTQQIIQQSVAPHRITIPEINFTSIISDQTNFSLLPINWKNDLIYFSNFSYRGKAPLLISSKENIVEDLKLGDKVVITGKNNGRYRYAITQTKQLPAKDFYRALEGVSAKVILISSTNFVGTELLLAFGK